MSIYKATKRVRVCSKSRIDNVAEEIGDTEGGTKRAAKDDHSEFRMAIWHKGSGLLQVVIDQFWKEYWERYLMVEELE